MTLASRPLSPSRLLLLYIWPIHWPLLFPLPTTPPRLLLILLPFGGANHNKGEGNHNRHSHIHTHRRFLYSLLRDPERDRDPSRDGEKISSTCMGGGGRSEAAGALDVDGRQTYLPRSNGDVDDDGRPSRTGTHTQRNYTPRFPCLQCKFEICPHLFRVRRAIDRLIFVGFRRAVGVGGIQHRFNNITNFWMKDKGRNWLRFRRWDCARPSSRVQTTRRV